MSPVQAPDPITSPAVSEQLATAVKAALDVELPPGVDAVDYDEKPGDASRHVQISVTRIGEGAPVSQRRSNRAWRITCRAIGPTVTNVRVYVDATYRALDRARLPVGDDLLTGAVKHETEVDDGLGDDHYSALTSWTTTLGARP